MILPGEWHNRALTDAVFAAARDTADAVARREMERDLSWAEHLRDALLVIEEDDDE